MNKGHGLQTGWTRSVELVALAKPLAVLLILLFSLSIHINASLAAGGDNFLCLSASVIDKNDDGTSSLRDPIKHCSLCTSSLNSKDLGLPPQIAFSDLRSSAVLAFNSADNLILTATDSPTSIRAPPFS